MNKNCFSIKLYQEGRLLETWDGLELEKARILYQRFFRDPDYGMMLYRDGRRLKCPEAWQLMGVSCGRAFPKRMKQERRGRPRKVSEVSA